MSQPQAVAAGIEARPELPNSDMERVVGYGVLGQPFESGHILALRRFPSTSFGPAYTAVWHRDPTGNWTFHITGEPHQCCNRYFGSAVSEVRRGDIAIDWSSPRDLTITTADDAVEWRLSLAPTPITLTLNTSGRMIPVSLWQQEWVLGMMGTLAGGMLQCGRMSLHGVVPNGQRFVSNPPLVWTVTSTSATVDGEDLGSFAPLPIQDRMRDVWMPQRGLFFAGSALFEQYDPDRHTLMACRSDTSASEAPTAIA